ncbi:MAG: hypothetical protein CEN90_510 [Parcubacteria group bacterium Licking1014_17]|nr:MAG: hypothetical protein CEN90_510 [Parcubacteria group bacterium Licking1014_17]
MSYNNRFSGATIVVVLFALILASALLVYNSSGTSGQASISGITSWLFGSSACTADAKLCPDGKTYVSRIPPKCEFAACPTPTHGGTLPVITPTPAHGGTLPVITQSPPPYSCITLGDINCDGKVDSGDALLIFQYVNSMRTLNSYQITRADLNKDGLVSFNDGLIIANKEVGYPVKIPYIFKVGDVTGDGIVDIGDALIIQQTTKGLRSDNYEYNIKGDVNNDGKVNNYDANIIMSLTVKLWGDVNGDGKINKTDVSLMEQSLNKTGKLLSPVQLKLADVNQDGKFNQKDIDLAKKK